MFLYHNYITTFNDMNLKVHKYFETSLQLMIKLNFTNKLLSLFIFINLIVS